MVFVLLFVQAASALYASSVACGVYMGRAESGVAVSVCALSVCAVLSFCVLKRVVN